MVVGGCDGLIRVRGRVMDASGAPVATARVRLEPAPNGRDFDDLVGPDGFFRMGRVVAPGRYNFTVHVTAPEFQPAHGVIRTIEDNRARRSPARDGL